LDYFVAKSAHVASVLVLLITSSVYLSSERVRLWQRLLWAVSVILVPAFGITLMLNLGLTHESWVMNKFYIWLILAVAIPTITKFRPQWRIYLQSLLIVCAITAAVLAVMKPS